MSKFISYTVGLECFVGDRGIKSVKVEYSEADDGRIKLQAVSGHNLESFGGRWARKISREAFDERPASASNNVPEAVWALDMLNLTPAALDA